MGTETNRSRFSRRAALAVLAATIIGGWILAGSQMSGEDPAQPGDVLVVLGGGAEGNRERLACRVWASGLVSDLVILTGSSQDLSIGNRTHFLQRCGIPAQNIRNWEKTANTYEEMRALSDFLDTMDSSTAIVVSDAPHMPRLRFLRKTLGMEGRVLFRESQLTIGPDAASVVRALTFWAREPAAFLYYRLRYHG